MATLNAVAAVTLLPSAIENCLMVVCGKAPPAATTFGRQPRSPAIRSCVGRARTVFGKDVLAIDEVAFCVFVS